MCASLNRGLGCVNVRIAHTECLCLCVFVPSGRHLRRVLTSVDQS